MVLQLLILLFIAFLPPLFYMIWIRNTERYEREPWKPVLLSFAWGATVAIIASLVLEIVLSIPLALSIDEYTVQSFIAAVLIAPFVEEFTKPLALGMKSVRTNLDELEDGLIYGAAAGLGFSATENLFYEVSFMSEGLLLFTVLVLIRTVGGCLLHASATALTGYGYGRSLLERRAFSSVLPFFMMAVGAHAFYNFIVSFELIGALAGIAIALLFAVLAIRFIRKKIKALDRENE